jgi:signal transduction histidine kinase
VSAINRLRAWFVPKSLLPEESFREKALRIAFPIVCLLRLPFVFIVLAPNPQLHIFGPLPPFVTVPLLIIPLILAYWSIVNKQITLAGNALMFAWVVGDLAGAIYQGYWLPSVQISLVADVVLATLILRQNLIVPYTVFLIAGYNFAVFTGGPFTEKFPTVDGQPYMPPVIIAVLVSIWLGVTLLFLRFFKGELNSRIEALQESVATLETKVKERTAELEMAKDAAERADKTKSAFLASMSHELRTPLNAIINFTKFVAKGFLGPVVPEQVEALDQVTESGKHLLALINDVLDMSKIEAGSLLLFIEDNVDLANLLSTVESTGKTLLDSKPVTLTAIIDKDLPHIRADRQRVLQILLNVMSNACKFTETGEIILQARRDGDQVLMSIKDSGPGIAAADHGQVFEAFKQTEAGLRQGSGTGLGMPISKNLAEAHGGRLWLESEPGKGATFYLSLPIKSETLVPLLINMEHNQ